MRPLAALALVTFAACGGGGTADPVDAMPPDSDPTCGEWTVVPAIGLDVRLFDPATTIALGRTIRIAFDVELTACEETGIVGISPALEDTSGIITPYVLRQIGGTCTGTARTVTRIVDYQPPQPGPWTLSIQGVGSVSFTVTAAPTPSCDSLRSPCVADCDCDESAGERCIGVNQGGPTTVCARTCEVDHDCGGNRCTGDAPGGTPYVCDAQPECGAGLACPTGFACTTGTCTPTFTLNVTSRHECACDADCETGLRCVRPYDLTMPNVCQAMCSTDGPWCEGAHVCGFVGQDTLSGTDSVCNFLGE
jgi:hypothetical protein